jgi:geranylgeranyl reductase family protein
VRWFDVAIVGAGPAGSSAAIFLARKGYSVALLDKSLFPRDKLCGDFLNPITWPLFERLGVADEFFSLEHEKVRAFRISSFTGEEATIPFPHKQAGRFFGLGLRRFYLDDLLLKRAEREGAFVQQGYRIRDLVKKEDGWFIRLGNHSAEEGIRSAVLIGADGRNSWVARTLGLARPSDNDREFVAFQIHLQGAKGITGDVQIHLFPGGYAGLVGLGGGMANLCSSIKKDQVKNRSSFTSLLEHYLYRNPHLRELLERAEVAGNFRSAYPVYFSPRSSCGAGFLLVGDAARVTEPVTGEGVYFALKSGELAAEAIDLAFIKGDFSAQIISHYKRACRRAFYLRHRVNSIIRALIYRPSLVRPSIRLACKTSFPIGPLVHFVCQTSNPEFLPHRI